jgi:hypothetical protein
MRIFKKIYSILLLIAGIYAIFNYPNLGRSMPETIGALIGVVLVTFLPAYFLFNDEAISNKTTLILKTILAIIIAIITLYVFIKVKDGIDNPLGLLGFMSGLVTAFLLLKDMADNYVQQENTAQPIKEKLIPSDLGQTPDDSLTRLKKAKEMLDNKLITDSDYETIKARIIKEL